VHLSRIQTRAGVASGHRFTRGKKDRIVGTYGDRLKVSIAAPANDNKANKRLLEFLASYLKCPQKDLTILRGLSSRKKTVAIHGQGLKNLSLLKETPLLSERQL
jgi:uncharacterized protein